MLDKLSKAKNTESQELIIENLDRRSLEFIFRVLKMVVSGKNAKIR